MHFKNLNREILLKFYNTMVVAVEYWVLSVTQMNRIDSLELRFLRSLFSVID